MCQGVAILMFFVTFEIFGRKRNVSECFLCWCFVKSVVEKIGNNTANLQELRMFVEFCFAIPIQIIKSISFMQDEYVADNYQVFPTQVKLF